jgi:class 3 adenylate cyclase/DNA-binding SARP family transcriptional activator/tetratricopeptide (TPR) repeat protein
MEYRVLGPLEVLDAGGRKVSLGGAMQQSVLASLLLRAGQAVALERLVDELWDEPPESATRTVQAYVSRLRHGLPGGAIEARAGGYTLVVDSDELDLNAFERRAEAGHEALAAGECARAAGLLREALALWRGPALAGLTSPALRRQAEGLEERRLSVLEDRLDADLGSSRHGEVVPELKALVAEQPFRERPRAQLMRALYRSGRPAEALAVYRQTRRLLADELGMEPGQELRELEQAILRQDAELDAPRTGGSAGGAEPLSPGAAQPAARAPARELRKTVTVRCPSCGEQADPGNQFCSRCGARIEQAAEPSAGPPEERRVITCLYADLVGSTQAAERVDPEDVHARVAPYHVRVSDELRRFGGTVEKFIGDAVVAIFGTPVVHEDDAERAVRAGLAIQQALDDLNKEDRSLALKVRVGIATGEALVQLVADVRSGEWLAAGDAMNVGARLQAAAPPGGILVDEATHRASRRTIEFRAAEAVRVTGKAEAIRVWEPVGPRSDAAGDTEAPFVGRADELDVLVGALARVVRTRKPQLITIVGVPGIGKSRLVSELFAVRNRLGDVMRLQGASVPYGEGISLHALSEMAKAYAGIVPTDDAENAARKVHDVVGAAVADPAEASWIIDHLSPLAGLGGAGELQSDRHDEAFAAWRRWIEALAERSPVALVFEDLHWADDTLLEFVEHVIDWTRDVPLLVVATTRPELFERRPEWGGAKWNALSVTLDSLTNEATSELISALLEQTVLPESLHERLLAHAGGNPLYAAQYVRMLDDRGLLLGDDSTADLLGKEEFPLPETVQAIIAARLDSLPRGEKALLQDAAVLGEVFSTQALAEVASVPREVVEQRLHALERTDFVRRERRSPALDDDWYAFRHVLVRDVTYGQLSRTRRAGQHRRAAEWIESVAGDRVDDRAELLAHHYLNAVRLSRMTRQSTAALEARAGRAAAEAGARAASLAAHGTAVGYFTSALELTPEDSASRARILLQLGQARLRADQAGAGELEEAREAFLEQRDMSNAAIADVLLSILRTNQGRREDALAHIRRAAGYVENVEPSWAKAFVLSNWSRLLMRAGEPDEAIRVGRDALALAQGLDLDELRAHALNNIGGARLAKGDHRGVEEFERSFAISRSLNSSESVRSCRLLGGALTVEGELERAFELFAEGRRLVERFGDAFERRWLAAALVLENYWRGCWDRAVEGADRFVAESEAHAPHYMETNCRRVRGLIRIARGDVSGALDDAAQALTAARIANDPWFLNQAIAFRARTVAQFGDTSEAERLADELLAIWARAEGATAPGYDAVDLAVALTTLGRGPDLGRVASSSRTTRWLPAALALADGRFLDAARLFREIGSIPDEVYAHLLAARETGDGRGLARALAFCRRVGASSLLESASDGR